jgi:hypothetical protein
MSQRIGWLVPPGRQFNSGKSTFARKHFKPTEILSSDYCRGLVSDDQNSQASTKDAFELLHFCDREDAYRSSTPRKQRKRRILSCALDALDDGKLVVKPLEFIAKSWRGLVQPAMKCRGREYLRIIYGPEYTAADNLERLRTRGLSTKRSLALREFALGVEALERFVRKEPLRRPYAPGRLQER